MMKCLEFTLAPRVKRPFDPGRPGADLTVRLRSETAEKFATWTVVEAKVSIWLQLIIGCEPRLEKSRPSANLIGR